MLVDASRVVPMVLSILCVWPATGGCPCSECACASYGYRRSLMVMVLRLPSLRCGRLMMGAPCGMMLEGEYGTYLGYGSCSLDGRVLLVSRHGGTGGYLRYANCPRISNGTEFGMALGDRAYVCGRAHGALHMLDMKVHEMGWNWYLELDQRHAECRMP